jgi:hypothetical protein
MFKELHLIDGIGVKTVHNIPWELIKDAPRDQTMTFVISAKQGKKNKNAFNAD